MSVTLHEGDVFAGRYRVVRLLAAGGMGAVYEVVHLETQRRRALKVMLPHVLQSEELRQRFQREALVTADVESEFIVDVFDAGVDDATEMPFLAMELLRGEELGRRIKRGGALPVAEAVGYLFQTALALDKTHRAGIVHRDLKPENIFLTEREDGPPRVKVLDFGVAKLIQQSSTIGGATEVVGTPAYMAPEQFRGGAGVTHAADIYALGMLAYTLLVGATYWKDEAQSGNAFAIALVAVRGPAEPASARAARRGVALPPVFDTWFATAAAVDPAQRFSTASGAIRALGEALGVPLPSADPSLRSLPRPADTPLTAGDAPVPQAPSSTTGKSVPLVPVTSSLQPPPSTEVSDAAARRTGLVIVAAGIGALTVLVAGLWYWQHDSTAEPVPAALASGATSSASPTMGKPERVPQTPPGLAPAPLAPATATASAEAPAPPPTASATAKPAPRPAQGGPKSPARGNQSSLYSQE